MTPRSRKPITAIESLTDRKSIGFESLLEESETNSPVLSRQDLYQKAEALKPSLDQYSIEQVLNENPNQLTETFKEYLINRNLLAHTEPPLPEDDDSFSSQPDDFVSSTDLKDLSESNMSESFLYCMNGNNPDTSKSDDAESSCSKKRMLSNNENDIDLGAYEPQTKKFNCDAVIGETTL